MKPIKQLITTRFKAVTAICFVTMIVLASCAPVTNPTPTSQPVSSNTNVQPVGTNPVDPFASSNNTQGLDSSGYAGPLFHLSYQYPTTLPTSTVVPPWKAVLKGQPISTSNGIAYANALKAYITPAMKKLLFGYQNWDAAKEGWYNQPWLASIQDPIHGAFSATSFPANTFTGQTQAMQDYAVVYYNDIAAYTLGQVWGKTAMTPTINTTTTQFPEGAVIVKLALIYTDEWSDMDGAAKWPLYTPDPDEPSNTAPQLLTVNLMQLDIIVKDSQASPKTGWVFTTLVFDNLVKGDAWDQMIPLGAMWGNDPDQDFKNNPALLQETVINPDLLPNPNGQNSPLYKSYPTETLGWGGRLSGPNDASVQTPAYVNGITANVAASSCMSCHSSSEWPANSNSLPGPSYLLPDVGPNVGAITYTINNAPVLFEPGSTQWMKWFQDRNGKDPIDAGTTAFDYDLVFANSLQQWYLATQKK